MGNVKPSGDSRHDTNDNIENGINKGKRDRSIDKPSGDSRRSTAVENDDGGYKGSFVVILNKPSGDSRQTANDNRANDRNEDKTGNK